MLTAEICKIQKSKYLNFCYYRKTRIVYVTDSSSSSSEADEGMQETPLSKRSKHGATEEENSDSDTNPVDSSQSKSPSSSSSEEEQVIEKKKCKMGLKHV